MYEKVRLRDADLAWREVDDVVVLLDLRTSEYLQVNSAGALLLPHLAEGADAEQLSSLLVQEFGIERARADEDVTTFLDDLAQAGLLEASGVSAPAATVAAGT